MAVDNGLIADQFALLAKLMDIHGENEFKSRSYSAAAFAIDKLPQPVAEIPADKLATIKGIGQSAAKKIIEIIETGRLAALDTLIEKTPPGVLEMLKIKGLGPKKIATIWKEMGIESVGELLYACNENRLLLYKGFGAKTQQNVQASIEFYMKSLGSHLYSETEPFARSIDAALQQQFPQHLFALTGQFRRQSEIINRLEWVTTATPEELLTWLQSKAFQAETIQPHLLIARGSENLPLTFYHATKEQFYQQLFQTSCSDEFAAAVKAMPQYDATASYASEEALFEAIGVPYIAPPLREQVKVIEQVKKNGPISLIQPNDIKGIIHTHSDWSDGLHTIEAMATACMEQGYEYLVISDHSKSAAYAKGLSEERIREQHRYIDELNAKLAPFRIFKSIECDILGDGSLDYSDNVLATFDLVIASIHSNLQMNEEKAMMRLLNAIRNPYTTILGHMTGRLLLSRPGYPVDHVTIIEACVEHQVAIELNAHPRRLDIDWRWIDYAVEKGAMIAIDPDAHFIEGFGDCRYGVLAAQKGGLRKEQNLSSFSLGELEEYLEKRKMGRGR
jgi:Histidinol phosphatase and related hydrolases of the PHP family